MIRGVVNARKEAVVEHSLRGPGGVVTVVEAVIDSGFSAALTIPSATADALGLLRESTGRAILADGSSRVFNIYDAELEWDGEWRPVVVSTIGDEVLLGMRLLARHELRIEVVPGGQVEITKLP